MFTWLNLGKPLIFVLSALVATLAVPAFSADTGALTSGTWESAATWTGGAAPTSADNVYIGSTYPNSPQATSDVTVTLTANESANDVKVGYGSPTNGVLDLGSHKLTIADTLWIGEYPGGIGSIVEKGGSFNAGTLSVFNGNSLTMGASDAANSIDIESNSVLTTSATGNIKAGGAIANGATLNLGANLDITSALNVESTGATTTFNMNGHNLTASLLDLGYDLTSAVTFNRGSGKQGVLKLNNLQIGNGQNLTLLAGDRITGVPGAIDIDSGATLTTVAAVNVTTTVNVVDGTLNLGANLSIGNQTVNEANGSTVNLQGHNLAASYLLFGYAGTSTVTLNRGSGKQGVLTLGNLFLGNGQVLNLMAGDTITSGDNGVNVTDGATLTTAATSNISKNDVNIKTGGVMTVNALLDLGSNTLNIQDSGSTVNLQGHNLTAGSLLLGYNGTSTVTLDRGSGTPGVLTLGNLSLGNVQNLNLMAGDTIKGGSNGVNVTAGATLTTAATSNISKNDVNVTTGGAMTLGARLDLSSNTLDVQDSGSVLNAQGNSVNAGKILVGSNGSAAVSVNNLGTVTGSELHVGNGSALTLHGGDVISSVIDLQGGAILTIQQSSTESGLTLNGNLTSSLTIDPTSMSAMDLVFTTPATGLDWAFRWVDPSSSTNEVSVLTSMIAAGQINVSLPIGEKAAVVDLNGYTYVEVAVPNPGDLDPGFGTDGVVTTPLTSDSGARSVALQSDGKIVVAGDVGLTPNFGLLRYNIDGTLDNSFGTGGEVRIDFVYNGNDYGTDYCYGVAVQGDGKIVAVGYTSHDGNPYCIALTRCNADGTPDTTFGGVGGLNQGNVVTNISGLGDRGFSVALQSDGKIVVAGQSASNFAVLRYNGTDGSLDSTFGVGGVVATSFAAVSLAWSVAVQSDGKIIAAGYVGNILNFNVALVRYNPDGSLDSTFGSGGTVISDIPGSNTQPYGLTLQGDGHILVAGFSASSFDLARFNGDGSLDDGFGTGGIVTTDFGAAGPSASIAVASDGTIIVGGASGVSGGSFALARYNFNGTLDTSFGTGGKVTTAIGSANSIALQSDGKIVAAGSSSDNFVVARYEGGATSLSNGSFDAGDAGFTSSYTYSTGPTSSPGSFSIATNPSSVDPSLASFGDHTTGTGPMMVVLGGRGTVWSESFPAQAGVWYRISYWAASASAKNPAKLHLLVNGKATTGPATFTLPAVTGQWEQFIGYWYAAASATATVTLTDSAPAGSGNDFALDDFALQRIAEPTDPGLLDMTAPVVTLTVPTTPITHPLTIAGAVKENFLLDQLIVSVNGVGQNLDAPLRFTPGAVESFSVTGVALQNGPNLVTVEAIDTSGNQTVVSKTVTYVDPSLTGLAGAYSAVLAPTGTPGLGAVGLVTLTVTAKGSFSGKVQVGGVAVPIIGFLENEGTARFSPGLQTSLAFVDGKSLSSPIGVLALSVSAANGMTGTLSTDASPPAVLASFTGKAAAATATAGQYNVAFPAMVQTPEVAAALYPQGSGFARVTVTRSGGVTLAGSLADGTPYSAGAKLRTDASAPLFTLLYGGDGFIRGELAFANAADTDVSGTSFLWLRPAQSEAHYYPAGFNVTVDAVGTAYKSPASLNFGQGPADATHGNASLLFSDGALTSPVNEPVSIDPTTGAVKIIPAANTSYKLSLTAATGLFSGAFTHTDTTTDGFSGILLNKGINKGGYGYFLSSHPFGSSGSSGNVFIDPSGP